ncbi:hypothetical protein PZ61_0235645 [Streptomyces sp. MNU77]|uniref:AtuA-related protein n=1 Tax=Streptomyces sp. MNU77 TaxID=1573406 RepID=UPI0005DAB7B3|nr:hypothetical protein [Streptomyces sp. MNU77]OLO25774.1 hypothetical protein PZ61_0235645 [Streptomyces sp. MNU77]
MKLREIAYAREGDKTDSANICVFPYAEEDWPRLRDAVTVEAVRRKFGDLVKGTVTRYEYPNLPGLNFVLTEALSGGVSLSLRVDGHGKTYASLLLDLDV